jgi:hypothetical protein
MPVEFVKYPMCTDCQRRVAVTNDGKLCRTCLDERLDRMTPRATSTYRPPHRSRFHRENRMDTTRGPVPSVEDAVRALEDLDDGTATDDSIGEI